MYAEIFGNKYKFNCNPDTETLLKEVLQLYRTPPSDSLVDVEVNFTDNLPPIEDYSQNPSVHKFSFQLMHTKIGNTWISWERRLDSKMQLHITIAIQKQNFLKKMLSRWRSMEFPSDVEYFVQILHELVLVPSQYFLQDRAPIHAAAIGSSSGCVLIAGTGGVGKSSALISVRDDPNLKFMADDIAVVDSKGGVFGNMAWPKIYGYNCIGNGMEKILLKSRGAFDNLHFRVRNRIDPTKVRRKIRPDALFQSTESNRLQLKALIYVFRENVDRLSIKPLESDVAAALTCSVLEPEYSIFHNHIHWSEYNAKMLGYPPMIRMDDIRRNWFQTYQSAFTGIECNKLIVPVRMRHIEYQSYIKDLISSTLK